LVHVTGELVAKLSRRLLAGAEPRRASSLLLRLGLLARCSSRYSRSSFQSALRAACKLTPRPPVQKPATLLTPAHLINENSLVSRSVSHCSPSGPAGERNRFRTSRACRQVLTSPSSSAATRTPASARARCRCRL